MAHFGASGVESVTLLQYRKCVPHVAVYKMDPEVGPACFPLPEPLQQAYMGITRSPLP